VFACLFALMVLADKAQSHAVLPAFVLGLVMSRHYREHEREQERLRVVAFAFLTPFFFLRGGMNVSLGAVFANLGVLAVLAAAKLVPKVGLVLPLARRHVPEHDVTTLLMSTGLAFGTISSLYGLNAHIIDRTQFSLLVTVVVLSAIVPTAIAQRPRRRGRSAPPSTALAPGAPGSGIRPASSARRAPCSGDGRSALLAQPCDREPAGAADTDRVATQKHPPRAFPRLPETGVTRCLPRLPQGRH
jgi:Kef-type K+ transport system membrane component KefB